MRNRDTGGFPMGGFLETSSMTDETCDCEMLDWWWLADAAAVSTVAELAGLRVNRESTCSHTPGCTAPTRIAAPGDTP